MRHLPVISVCALRCVGRMCRCGKGGRGEREAGNRWKCKVGEEESKGRGELVGEGCKVRGKKGREGRKDKREKKGRGREGRKEK